VPSVDVLKITAQIPPLPMVNDGVARPF